MSIKIGDQVQDVLDGENITLQELEDMVARAAITSLRGATRRYHHWFFVYDPRTKMLERMFKHVDGMDLVSSWSTCESCGGWGCKTCDWSGELAD